MLNMINSLSNANWNNHWSWSFLTWNSKTALGEVTQRFRQPEIFQNCNFPLTRLAFGVTEFGFQVNHKFSNKMQVINHVPGIQRQALKKPIKLILGKKDFGLYDSYKELSQEKLSIETTSFLLWWGWRWWGVQSTELFSSNNRF